MQYLQQRKLDGIKRAKCSECGSASFKCQQGKVICINCDHVISKDVKQPKRNKYGAIKTMFNGRRYDSKFEALVASSLESRKQAGDIKDYDNQYRIEVWCYNKDGEPQFLVRHKVDFRVHLNDGTYELVEAKGVETTDYKWRKKFIKVFLSENPSYTYKVIKQ